MQKDYLIADLLYRGGQVLLEVLIVRYRLLAKPALTLHGGGQVLLGGFGCAVWVTC